MSSNDDSPTSQPHSAQSGIPTASNKNPQIDTVDALLRIIFRMGWADWTLIAILISLLINHYFFNILNVAQPIIDFTRLITALISVIFIAYKVVNGYKSKELITIFFKNHPLQLFVSIIACGATTSFFLPLILNLFRFIGETDKLTTALLASTGGVIAVFTLIKTHQKNQNDEQALGLDREKYNQQIKDREEDIKRQEAERLEQKEQFEKNLEAQSEKNNQDHTRQVHAERRSRYTTAVEQLANENAAVRLGGIYTLAGLVDEWLADKSIKEENDRRQEGQVIINNLCAYIRSPFLPAERLEAHEVRQRLKAIEKFEANLSPYETTPQYQDISKRYKRFIENSPHKEPEDIAVEYAKLYEEQDIRRSIFTIMSNRVNRFDKKQGKSIPGLWSGFDFNFRNSKIFYPLNDINIESPNFNGATFIINANLQGSYLSGKVSLINATFRTKAEFSRAIFNSELDKENSETIGAPERFDEKIITNSTFYKTVFEQEASFTDSIFFQCPEFMNTKFMNDADFADSLFNFNTAKNLRLYSRNMLVGQTSMPSGPPGGFILPLGARLFDPGSWDEAHQEYRVSEPAKPLDESD